MLFLYQKALKTRNRRGERRLENQSCKLHEYRKEGPILSSALVLD